MSVSHTQHIVTPKEKVVQNQALTTKKKKFFRLLQSNDQDSPYFAIASVQLQEELHQRMFAMINQIATTTENQSSNGEKATVFKEGKKRRKMSSSSNAKKTIRHSDLLFGLSQILKVIEGEDSCQRIVMVWFNHSLAINLQNVLKKLCTSRKVSCLAFDLESLRQMFNLSSLSVMAFKSNVLEACSMFHDIYNVASKIFPFNPCNTLSNKEEQMNLNNCDSDQKKSSSTQIVQVMQCYAFKDRHSFYFSRHEKRYHDIMRERLSKSNMPSLYRKRQFALNLSFVELVESDLKINFPDRFKRRENLLSNTISIEWPCKPAYSEETAKRSHHFAKQLFELDKIEAGSAKQDHEIPVPQFYPPRLLKGQLDGHKSTLKRTKKAKRAALKKSKN